VKNAQLTSLRARLLQLKLMLLPGDWRGNAGDLVAGCFDALCNAMFGRRRTLRERPGPGGAPLIGRRFVNLPTKAKCVRHGVGPASGIFAR
jgi:hypothetical protein